MLYVNKGKFIEKDNKTGTYNNRKWELTTITYEDEKGKEHKVSTFKKVPIKEIGEDITIYIYVNKRKNIYEVCKVE